MDTTELNRLYDFHGKTVVITGGTGVLGSEIARALVGCGANVAILARRLAPAEQIVERMGARAGQAAAISADVVDPNSLQNAAEKVRERFGGVDCLLNAAGGNQPQATTGGDLRFFDLPAEALRHVFVKAFEQSKEIGMAKLSDTSATKVTLPFGRRSAARRPRADGRGFLLIRLRIRPQDARLLPRPAPCAGSFLAGSPSTSCFTRQHTVVQAVKFPLPRAGKGYGDMRKIACRR